ncbi:HEAT repeat domain-containing protein [Actinocorallia populi]|uniref:HEAT repeat domain-containing protein n=1 Tax=Actinocorallia populi TaxID=2079200 RepID=UPI0013002979|nr:HEAT repeat domain-containing protein [Actinocorallia populi]
MGGGMAARLENVDWSVVISPGTARRHGPELVLDLWRPEAAEAALRTLRQVCALGEYLYPAAAELLPVLVEAAADPAVSVRARLVECVGEIAATAAGVEAEGRVVRPPAMAYLRAGPRPAPAEQARTRRMTGDWSQVWGGAVTGLVALLDDPSWEVRRSAATALAQATGRADEVTALLQRRFEAEKVTAVAERLVDSVGRLADRTGRPADAVAWLRARLTRADEARPDVRLAAVRALRHVLPGHDDPAYARAVTGALLSPGRPFSIRDGGLFDLDASEVCAADALLGGDLPGRLALARALLRHGEPRRRTGGIQAAVMLMADRRAAVPALLPAVAALAGDPLPDNRALALRALAMCGTASRPWADAAAAHLTPDGEPDPRVRTQALWALCRMGDDRGVPVLAERMATPVREKRDGFRDWRPESNQGRWRDLEPNFCEMLAPFAAHHDVLLPALMVKMAARHDRIHYPRVLVRWHRDGAPVVPALVGLLDTGNAVWAAHALAAIDPGPVAAGRERRLRALLGSAEDEGMRRLRGPRDSSSRVRLDPIAYWHLTGDPGPALAILRSGRLFAGQRDEVCAALGPAAAGEADRLRRELPSAAPARVPFLLRTLWRVTGDPGEAVPALLDLSAPYSRRGPAAAENATALMTLAEMAAADPSVAAQASDRLRDALRDPARLGHERTLVIARVLWRAGGRPDEVAPALTFLAASLGEPADRLALFFTRLETLALLAEAAAADPVAVAPALPGLRALADADERPLTHRHWRVPVRRHWRSVEADDVLRAAVQAVLDVARPQ